MRRKLGWIGGLGAAVACLCLRANLQAASPEVVVNATEGERFDLSKLADGETRVFGSGERTVTATRRGDDVTMDMKGSPEGEKSITCSIGKDSCYVITTGKDGRTMLFSTRPGDKEPAFAWAMAEGGDGDDEDVVIHSGRGGEVHVRSGSASATASASGEGAVARKVIVMRHGPDEGETMLRCPEGDTTMMLKKDEAKTGYTCPKHGVPLEEIKGEPKIMRRVVIEREGGDKDGEKK